MYKWGLVFFLFLVACSTDEIELNSDEPIKPNQFVKAFKVIKDGFEAKDTNVFRFADTQKISIKVLNSVIPDSITSKWIDKETKTVFRPVGRIEKTNYNYVLLLIQKPKKYGLVAVVFDKENKFVTYKILLSATDNNSKNYLHSVSVNKEPTFYIIREKFEGYKELKYTKTGWALSNNSFMVVVNESNELSTNNQPIINPIDTLPINNKFSGNYTINDRNILALRDGYTPREYKFFLYMEQDNGKCTGELKGTMVLSNDNHATYTQNGDPCVIDFTLNSNSIDVKEKGSCGNRRSLDCKFEDTYIKRKLVRKSKQDKLITKPKPKQNKK